MNVDFPLDVGPEFFGGDFHICFAALFKKNFDNIGRWSEILTSENVKAGFQTMIKILEAVGL